MIQLSVQSDRIMPELQKHLVQIWTIPAVHCGWADQIVVYTDSMLMFVYYEYLINVNKFFSPL